MYNILDIDNLIEDINDISTHAAEQKEHNIERLFKIFTAAATIETLYNILAVLVPLLVDWTKTGEMPLLFPTQIGTLALCVLTVLLLSILFILTPKLLKNK